jgi:hypothetical protein
MTQLRDRLFSRGISGGSLSRGPHLWCHSQMLGIERNRSVLGQRAEPHRRDPRALSQGQVLQLLALLRRSGKPLVLIWQVLRLKLGHV